MKRPALYALLPFLLSSAAAAQGWEEARASGQMEVTVQSVGVNNGDQTDRRTLFGQKYTGKAVTPLLLPGLGMATADAIYESGNNVHQMTQGSEPATSTAGVGLTAVLLTPDVQRYFNASPFFRRTQTVSAWGGQESRKMVDTTMGANMGVFFPGLPTANLSVSETERRDASAEVPGSQRNRDINGRVSWFRGPFRAEYRQERQEINDTAAKVKTSGDNINAETQFTMRDMEAPLIDALDMRVDYSEQGLGASGGGRRRVTQYARAVSDKAVLGPVENRLTYGQSSSVDLTGGTRRFGQDVTMESTVSRTTWNAGNQLRFENNPGSVGVGHGLVDRPQVGRSWLKGLVRYDLGGEVFRRWGNSLGSRSGESVNQRASVYPIQQVDLYATHNFGVVEAAADGTRLTTNGGGGGATWRVIRRLSVSSSYHADLTSGTSRPEKGFSQAVTMGARFTPLAEASADLLYSINRSRMGSSPASSTHSLLLGANARLLDGLQLNGTLNRVSHSPAGAGNAGAGLWNGKATASYSLGKMDFIADFEMKEISTPRSYDTLSFTMRRRF